MKSLTRSRAAGLASLLVVGLLWLFSIALPNGPAAWISAGLAALGSLVLAGVVAGILTFSRARPDAGQARESAPTRLEHIASREILVLTGIALVALFVLSRGRVDLSLLTFSFAIAAGYWVRWVVWAMGTYRR